jgi:pyridoxine 5-phosphate synthase
MLLGVNIDHIAVLREARQVNDPNPLDALAMAKLAGADQITIHLREDRRHIRDEDVRDIIRLSPLPVNLECSMDPEILKIVKEVKPFRATLVPEKREELTTEGGLDVARYQTQLEDIVGELKGADIATSLFVDPDEDTVTRSAEVGADMIELHTGHYANIYGMLYSNIGRTPYAVKELDLKRDELEVLLTNELSRLDMATDIAGQMDLLVAAGHGLNYQNTRPISKIEGIMELNIGQSIIARSVWVGFERAVKEMVALIGDA